MAAIHFSAGHLTYYLFLTIFSLMSTILSQLVQRVSNDSDDFALVNNGTSRFYEEDVFILLNRIPEILPIIGALFVLDEHGYKVRT